MKIKKMSSQKMRVWTITYTLDYYDVAGGCTIFL